MDKDTFLRLQYLRMLNSEEFVIEQWRSSVDRFIADLWDRTPIGPGGRFLAPVDPSLGFSPDNVEWQFPKVRKRPAKSERMSASKPPRPTKAERKESERAAREAEREAKRKAIAEEFARWERLRAAR